MNFSRQALLGVGMIIGGSVMLYAMVQQIGETNTTEPVALIADETPADTVAATPLTTDIDTEKRILAQKQRERAARVAEQERRAQAFMLEQESAEAQALAKARAENQQYRDNSAPSEDDNPEAANLVDTTSVQPQTISTTSTAANTVNRTDAETEQLTLAADRAIEEARAERQAQGQASRQAANRQAQGVQQQTQTAANSATEAPQAVQTQTPNTPSDYKVKRGDGLIKLARQYNVPIAALAQANDLSVSSALQLGQTIKVPSRSQVERLEQEAKAAEQARIEARKRQEALARKSEEAKLEAQQKLSAARQEVKETDAKGSFGVQVSLASNQAAAERVVKRFKDAGYQVTTSNTSRGVRVVVGPERGKVAALALKDKINSDPKVDTTNAWVRYW